MTQALSCLEELKQFNEKHETEKIDFTNQKSRALILKSSKRVRDHFEAETILKKILDILTSHGEGSYFMYIGYIGIFFWKI